MEDMSNGKGDNNGSASQAEAMFRHFLNIIVW